MPVYPSEENINGLQVFQEPMPADPCEASEVLELLQQHGAPATIAQTGGRYFGFVNGGVVPGCSGGAMDG